MVIMRNVPIEVSDDALPSYRETVFCGKVNDNDDGDNGEDGEDGEEDEDCGGLEAELKVVPYFLSGTGIADVI